MTKHSTSQTFCRCSDRRSAHKDHGYIAKRGASAWRGFATPKLWGRCSKCECLRFVRSNRPDYYHKAKAAARKVS